ncbi:hypothetical protein [Streptomyces sp. NPDC058385]|uniref:hypothetical protein n=1 Tax=Streptomyces sp. NPDC058385 TaxID=3346473 RepID=UPI00365CFD78
MGVPALDDVAQMFPRLRQDRDVVQRVDVEDGQAGVCADGECADPASSHKRRAAVVVAERIRSATGCTWVRRVNRS